MSRRTLLFCPWSHGVGFGYLGRALVVAAELMKHGYRCVFSCDTREGLVARAGMEVVPASGDHGLAVPDMGIRQGDYIPIDNLDTVFGIARYYHRSRVSDDLENDLRLMEEVRPDAVVVDMQPTAAMAAQIRGIPWLSLADSDFLRDEDNSWMPWLDKQDLAFMPYPSCLGAFNEVRAAFRLSPIDHVSDLLWGDLTLIASSPELEASLPPLRPRGAFEWVGPIYWEPPWVNVGSELSAHGTNADCRIYVTLGHGGKATGAQIAAVLDGCADPRWAVFASLGFRHNDEAPSLPTNAIGGTFTGIEAPIRWSDIVISHGGHATVLASLLWGKPSIVIPFMSEQEANGIVFVERQGAGFVLRRTLASSGPGHFRTVLRYSGPSLDGQLPADDVSRAVGDITANPSFRERAMALSGLLQKRCHERSFVKLVQQLW